MYGIWIPSIFLVVVFILITESIPQLADPSISQVLDKKTDFYGGCLFVLLVIKTKLAKAKLAHQFILITLSDYQISHVN